MDSGDLSMDHQYSIEMQIWRMPQNLHPIYCTMIGTKSLSLMHFVSWLWRSPKAYL